MIQETPIVGKIYKVKLTSGDTWIFKSAYCGNFLTEHQGAYCFNSRGNSYFEDYVSKRIGCHVHSNEHIISLVPANENEIAIFNRKLGL